MEIRMAKTADIPHIAALYESAKASLASRGIDQWQDGYPNAQSAAADIEAGIGFVAEENGEILGTAAIFVGHDNTYDYIENGAWQTENTSYGVMHRVAVSPAHKGRGIAARFVEKCVSLCNEVGASSLRCDTHLDNHTMQHTLEKNGFVRCGTIYLEDGSARIGYERVL